MRGITSVRFCIFIFGFLYISKLSGNVIFKSSETADTLPEIITRKIKEVYDFEVPVLVLSRKELVSVKENNLYLKSNIPIEQLLITFLSEPASQERIDTIERVKYLPDEFIIDGSNIYLHIVGGIGKSKLSNNFFEKKLNVSATTRNLKTVNKLIELSE